MTKWEEQSIGHHEVPEYGNQTRKQPEALALLTRACAGGVAGAFLGVSLFLLADSPAQADTDMTHSHIQPDTVITELIPSRHSLEADVLDYRHRIPAWSKPDRQIMSLSVTATAYNCLPEQTDDTPNIAAWGDTIEPGMKLIAVSRDLLKQGLKRGTLVRISGLDGEFKVLDKMNKRFKKRIDVYMGKDVKAARSFGKKKVTINWVSEPEPTLIAQR